MAVHLVNANGESYTLPATMTIMDLPRQRSVPLTPRLTRDGSVQADDPRVGPLSFTLVGTVKSTEAEIRSLLNTLVYHFSLGEVKLYPEGATDDRYLLVQMLGFSRPKRTIEKVGDITVQLVAPTPYLLSPEVTTSKTVTATPTAWSPTVNGKASVRPKFTITSDPTATAVSAIRITDTATGEFMEYSGQLDTGEVLVVDCDKFTMTKGGANVLNQAHETFLLDGFKLAAGARSLEITVGTGTPKLTVDMAYQPRWYW